MVAWIKSFENSLQNVLGEIKTGNQVYLEKSEFAAKILFSSEFTRRPCPLEAWKTRTQRLRFLLRLSDMGLYSL